MFPTTLNCLASSIYACDLIKTEVIRRVSISGVLFRGLELKGG
jgi:hypothetical protein